MFSKRASRSKKSKANARFGIPEVLEDRRMMTVIEVTSLADGDSGGGGALTLREALAEARDMPASEETVTITFAPELFDQPNPTIHLSQNLGELVVDRANLDGNDLLPDLVIDGGTGITIDASIANASSNEPGFRVMRIDDGSPNAPAFPGGPYTPGALVHLNNLTITGGQREADSSNVSGGEPFFTCSTVSGGGGLAVLQGERLELNESHVTGNSSECFGGGIAVFENQLAAPPATNVTLRNSTVTDNETAGDGGGIFVNGWGGATYLRAYESEISGNKGFNGGGISITGYQSAFFELHQTTVSGNFAESNGGGIYAFVQTANYVSSLLKVQDSTIANNVSSGNGGGVHLYSVNLYDVGGSELEITQTTIANNTAFEKAGGLYVSGDAYDHAITVDVKHTTITRNAAVDDFAGLYAKQFAPGHVTLDVLNTIVSGNEIRWNPATVHSSSNIEGTYETGGISGLIDSPMTGLGPLADNGGNTRTIEPLANSPVVDSGDPTDKLDFDQRGATRIQGSQIDIGSVEFDGTETPFLPEDMDGDGDFDCDDIDALVFDVIHGVGHAPYDLNSDGNVDIDDVHELLRRGGSLPGDANLDGVTDVSDYNIWNSNKFQFGGEYGLLWCAGDFNADGAIDVSDSNEWNRFKFMTHEDWVNPGVKPPVGPVGPAGPIGPLAPLAGLAPVPSGQPVDFVGEIAAPADVSHRNAWKPAEDRADRRHDERKESRAVDAMFSDFDELATF